MITRSSVTVCLLVFFLGHSLALAGPFPTALDATDRQEMAQLLGFSSAMKLVSDPYPLGGYEGLQLGLVGESIPVGEFRNWGDGSGQSSNLSFASFQIAKGIYKNWDGFVNFALQLGGSTVSSYGAMLRWTFFESQRIPLSMAVNLHGSNNNFANLITGDSAGVLLDIGLYFEKFSSYLAVGRMTANYQFDASLNRDPVAAFGSASDVHLRIGGVYHLRPFFIGLEWNRHLIQHLSLQIGLRY